MIHTDEPVLPTIKRFQSLIFTKLLLWIFSDSPEEVEGFVFQGQSAVSCQVQLL